jgi:AraC-like DNA-binding protein
MVEDEDLPKSCQVVAWRPPVPGISEVFHARIEGYRYPDHCHDTWTLLIVDDGAIRYDLGNRHRWATGAAVTLLPPGIVHNGYPAERFGRFCKRNLYLDGDFLPSALIGPAVDRSTFSDAELRTAISALHDRLVVPELLDVEVRLAMMAERFRLLLDQQARPPTDRYEANMARALRDYLDGHFSTPVRIADAARLLGRSVPHLVRCFKREFGIAPHAYLIGVRIEAARKRLLQGEPAATVAVEVGFHDHAHLNRHFKRHLPVPPARYAASHRH